MNKIVVYQTIKTLLLPLTEFTQEKIKLFSLRQDLQGP